MCGKDLGPSRELLDKVMLTANTKKQLPISERRRLNVEGVYCQVNHMPPFVPLLQNQVLLARLIIYPSLNVNKALPFWRVNDLCCTKLTIVQSHLILGSSEPIGQCLRTTSHFVGVKCLWRQFSSDDRVG